MSASDKFQPLRVRNALKMNPNEDPNCLLGKRFLCRGSGGVIVGASGTGKSSFAIQFACHLAVGRPFFGIEHPNPDPQKKPLRVLLVQAENDDYEVAEVLQSITEDWNESDKHLLDKNLFIHCVWGRTGAAFAKWLDECVDEHKIDVAFVDPLMSYSEGDVSNNQAMGMFLRTHINAILKAKPSDSKRMKFGLIFIHHTPKPGRKTTTPAEATAYDMMGASELTNWARFVINLIKHESSDQDPKLEKELQGRLFDLTITKRGNRSEICGDPGEWRCMLQHSNKPGIKSAPVDGDKENSQSVVSLNRIHWEIYKPLPGSSPAPQKPKRQRSRDAKPANQEDVLDKIKQLLVDPVKEAGEPTEAADPVVASTPIAS